MIKFIRSLFIPLFIYSLIHLFPYSMAHAQVDIKTDPAFSSLRTFTSYGSLVNVIVQNAFVLAGVISFIILVFGGFSIIMGAGGGDTKKLEQGKQAMVGAVMGLLIVVCSMWIVQAIEVITGVKLLSPK